MKENKIKYALLLIISTCSATIGFSQNTSAAKASALPVSVNTILCTIALVLLFIIIVLAMTVNSAIDFYKLQQTENKDSSVIKNITVFIGFILLSQFSFAQNIITETGTALASSDMSSTWYFYGFISIIIAEIAIILFFIKTLSFLTGIDKFKKTQVKNEKSIWETINQFKPLEEEDNMDTGHNYDGIRELDNITPPWFVIGFAASILFAIVYLYRFEVAKTAPTQLQEFETEMREAKIVQDSLLKLEGNNIDENTVAMLDASGIESGKKVYVSNCAACHGDKGQGGVGPNLTDAYWLHGGSISEVFKSIKYGWEAKGMKPWKDDFSPTQIAQISSYIESLKGTNPPGAKEKQGELYVETVVAISKVDSTQTK